LHRVIVNQKEPIAAPCHIASDFSVLRHVDRYTLGAAETWDVVDCNLSRGVQDRMDRSHWSLDLVLSRLNSSHVRQGHDQTDRSVATHSQIANIITEDHPGGGGRIDRLAEKSTDHDVGSTRLVNIRGAKRVVLVAKTI